MWTSVELSKACYRDCLCFAQKKPVKITYPQMTRYAGLELLTLPIRHHSPRLRAYYTECWILHNSSMKRLLFR